MKKLVITLLFIFSFSSKSYSLIEVDITRGNLNPLPIAVSPLFSDKSSQKNLNNILKIKSIGDEISTIVENNLKTTGLFNPLEKKGFSTRTWCCPFKT